MAALALQVDGMTVEYSIEGSVLVGRDPACDVQIHHELVSRRHLELRGGPTGWTATDLATSNGTFCAGEQLRALEPFVLASGCVLRLGDPEGGAVLRVLNAEPPAPVEHSQGRAPARSAHHEPVTIGRAGDNAIVLTEPLVSAHHARFTPLSRGGFRVEDLGSTNGTYVDGVRVGSTEAPWGSVVSLGGVLVELTSQGVHKRPPGGDRPDADGARASALSVQQVSFSVPARTSRGSGQEARHKVLVDRVSFSVPYCSLLAVIGPSGAGKSTLLRLLTGAARPDRGQILVDGIDLELYGSSIANRIGVVPQDDLVHPELTARQALDYAARLRFSDDSTAGQRSAAVDWAIAELGLHAQADTRVDRLSGGQRKRVSTAMELLTKPDLLFLDEPTSGLDPNLDREVMGLLRELAHGTSQSPQGRTVVVITHATDNLDQADLVLVLAPGGKVAYFGAPEGLRTHFADGSAEPSYADIYARITSDPDAARDAFEAHHPSSARSPSRPVEHPTPASRPRRRRFLPQTIALLSRQARLMAADRSLLMFTTALPIVVGLLTMAVRAPSGFNAATETDAVADPRVLTVVLVFGAVLMGLVPSVRQLVAERPIFVREAGIGVRASAYLTSKVVLLGVVCCIQSALMVSVALLVNPHPGQGVFWPLWLELFVVTLATAWCCAALGLLLSGLVNTSEQVMPLMVLVLMFQLVMCGGVITVTGPGINQVSLLSPSRWGFAAVASSLDFNRTITCNAEILAKAAEDREVNRKATEAADEANRRAADDATRNGLPEPAAEVPKIQHTVVNCAAVDGQDPLWEHSGLRLLGNLLALAFWFVVYCCGCWATLRRRTLRG